MNVAKLSYFSIIFSFGTNLNLSPVKENGDVKIKKRFCRFKNNWYSIPVYNCFSANRDAATEIVLQRQIMSTEAELKYIRT